MIVTGAFTRSTSFRVGALFSILSAAAIMFIIYFWTLAKDETFLREAKAAIDAEIFSLQNVYDIAGEEAVFATVNRRITATANTTFIALRNVNTKRFTSNLPAWPQGPLPLIPSAIELNVPKYIDVVKNETDIHTTKVVAVSYPIGVNLEVFVARNVEDLYRAQWIGHTLSWVFICLLSLIAALSICVLLYVVKRINYMSRTADSIMQTGNLRERLETDSTWDDLNKLAVVFNRMMDKIDESVINFKSVSDNIAHDLRTPLTRLRAKLDQIESSKLRSQAINEADYLLGMFNDLLRIADIESKRQRQGFEKIELDTIVADVVDLYSPLAEKRKMPIFCELENITYRGDRNLLFQAFANVLDNSLQHAGSGAEVRIELVKHIKVISLSINDSGRGLSPDHFEKLERRFYRAEESRTTRGNGLGLSMVRAVIALHYGHIWFVDDPNGNGSGFGVTITLPVLPSQSL